MALDKLGSSPEKGREKAKESEKKLSLELEGVDRTLKERANLRDELVPSSEYVEANSEPVEAVTTPSQQAEVSGFSLEPDKHGLVDAGALKNAYEKLDEEKGVESMYASLFGALS
ncbi:MAG: hypothetical protein ACI9QC_000238 [Oceanicoccus sp.]|jgi:hypothetical protein